LNDRSPPRPRDVDARNRESDVLDDYLDARHEARRTGSSFFAYVANVLFGRWHAMRRRDD
jgi:hypothetical protein